MGDDELAAARRMSRIKLEDGAANGQPEAMGTTESTPTHAIKDGASPASVNGVKSESDGVNTPASGKPRLSRRSSQKPVEPEPRLFNHLPDVTEESCKSFQVIRDCLYGSKNLGSTDNDALDCDCAEEFRTCPFCVIP
jgi:histone-lysine N-methyltransferase SETD2